MPVPSSVNAALPASVDEWFARACARDVGVRFGSAKDMADAFRSAIGSSRLFATAPIPLATPSKPELRESGGSRDMAKLATTTSPTSARPVSEMPAGLSSSRSIKTKAVFASVAIAGVLALGVGIAVARRSTQPTRASAIAEPQTRQSAATVPSPQPQPTTAQVVPRHPCGAELASHCGHETRAWCGADEHPIACCQRDLVATGKDGICDCAPGGYEGTAGPPNCQRAHGDGAEARAAVIQGLRPRFRACYNGASNESLAGRMLVSLELTPDGSVFSARIAEGQMASAKVQSCILDAIRTVQFDPPVGGSATVTVPISFDEPHRGSPSGMATVIRHATGTPSSTSKAPQPPIASVSTGLRAPNCNPPFYFDKAGNKVFKEECTK